MLEPLQNATEFFSHEKHPTIGAATSIIKSTILPHLRVAEAEADDPIMTAFSESLAKDIPKRWKSTDNNTSETFLLAVYLDPRFKDFRFITDARSRHICVGRAAAAVTKITNATPSLWYPLESRSQESDNDDAATLYVDRGRRLFGKAVIVTPSSTSTGAQRKADEVEHYRLKHPCPTFEEGPLSASGSPL